MVLNDKPAQMFEEYLAALEFPAEPQNLYAPLAYALEGSGKRLRPRLLMTCCSVFGNDLQAAMPAAAAVEIFHNYTLLHDDIMDNAPTRRGRPSVYSRWGLNVAILSGDVMLIWAYRVLERSLPQHLPALLAAFNRAAAQVCEGQQYDMDFEDETEVPLERYLEMTYLKTASLIAAAARMGAIAGGASEEDCGAVERFATHLGQAFQLQDDLLDTYGDAQLLGKEVGGDIVERKKTFLLITALNMASPVVKRELQRLMEQREFPVEELVTRVREIYDSLGVREAALEAIAEHHSLAVGALDALSVAPERSAPLRELAATLIDRVR